jgi:hypothetical protein
MCDTTQLCDACPIVPPGVALCVMTRNQLISSTTWLKNLDRADKTARRLRSLELLKLIELPFSHLSSIFAQGGHDYLSNAGTIVLIEPSTVLSHTRPNTELVSRLTHGKEPNKGKEKAFPLMATVWLGHWSFATISTTG